jgi:hypothetical protein
VTATVPAAATTGPITLTTAGGTVISKLIFTVLMQPPYFRTFYPQQGQPGSKVTLSGRYLTTTTAISFNGVAAEFSVLNDSSVTATVPATATTGPITLVTAGGTITSKLIFTVKKPHLHAFFPRQGEAGTSVILLGKRLKTIKEVRFNGVTATKVKVNLGFLLTAVVPADATSGPISVELHDGGQATSRSAFTVLGATPVEVAGQPVQRSEMAPEAAPAPALASAAYPNPFTTGVTIPLILQAPATVQLNIYTQTGQLINQITTGQLRAGMQQLEWNGRNSQGQLVATGLYFYRLLVNGKALTGKLLKTDAAR